MGRGKLGRDLVGGGGLAEVERNRRIDPFGCQREICVETSVCALLSLRGYLG